MKKQNYCIIDGNHPKGKFAFGVILLHHRKPQKFGTVKIFFAHIDRRYAQAVICFVVIYAFVSVYARSVNRIFGTSSDITAALHLGYGPEYM